jgi:predicted 3-demethylubiquinone-9 3-methyltransferase (glyoxalase superfamily)
MVLCKSQEEIDDYWSRLSFVPEAEQCGWLKDQFGLSWQIVPENMNDVYLSGTKEEARRVTQAFLSMKKLDMAAIEKARLGE